MDADEAENLAAGFEGRKGKGVAQHFARPNLERVSISLLMP